MKLTQITIVIITQWMSLHRNLVLKLLDSLNIIVKYKKAILNRTIRIKKGAPDEFILIHTIINDICKRDSKKCNIIKNNLRFVKWRKCKVIHCPNYLEESNVSEKEIKLIKKNNLLIIRKINYKNYKAIDLVNKIKGE